MIRTLKRSHNELNDNIDNFNKKLKISDNFSVKLNNNKNHIKNLFERFQLDFDNEIIKINKKLYNLDKKIVNIENKIYNLNNKIECIKDNIDSNYNNIIRYPLNNYQYTYIT